MNVDSRILLLDGERAVRRGDPGAARACFLEAAQAAADVQLWRSALRCYRHALELDLLDREVVERVRAVPPRVMIILRRALWPAPRERAAEPMTVRVTFDGRERLVLDEHGEWEPIIGEPARVRGPAR